MSQPITPAVIDAAVDHAPWVCHACHSVLGTVMLEEQPYLALNLTQLTGRVNLPVTFHCNRCGTDNHLGDSDLQRWERRGARGPIVSAWPSPLPLARPA